MNKLFFRLIVVFHVICTFIFSQAEPLTPLTAQFSIKNGNLNGNTDIYFAEFSFKFDEDLYFHYPAPCAAGLCAPQFQEANVTQDPCYPVPCDFTLKGDRCGTAAHPSCEAQCAALRPTLCTSVQDWEVLEVGEEHEPFEVTPKAYKYFRFNWAHPCKALHLSIVTIYGHLSAFVSPFEWDLTTSNSCAYTSIPDAFLTLCPSHQRCYRYGTYVVRVRAWSHRSLGTIKVSALDIEDVPMRTVPLPDAPPALIQPNVFPFHVPLQFSVPLFWTFTGAYAYLPLVLSTTYCGVVHLQVELSSYDYPYDFLAAFVSLDNPFPSDPFSEMVFLTGITQTLFICPSAAPTVNLFVGIARNFGQFYGLPLSFYVTVDYQRPGLLHPPPLKIGDRGTFSNYTAFPDTYWYNYASGMFRIDCPTDANALNLTSAFSCRQGCNKFHCCLETWAAFPTDELQFFFPVPDNLRLRNEYNIFSDYEYPADEINPRRAGTLLLLERHYNGSPVYGPLGPQWRDLVPYCKVSPDLSAVATLDGRWIARFDLPLQTRPPACDVEAFSTVSSKISRLIDALAGFQPDPSIHSLNRSISQRFRADSHTLSDAWIGCISFLQQDLLAPNPLNLTSDKTTVCPSFDPTDPCCNNMLWDQCCVPRSLTLTTEYPSHPLQTTIAETCALPNCTTDAVTLFAQGSIGNFVGRCNPPTRSSALVTTDAFNKYTAAFDRYFGDVPTGLRCFADADCPAAPTARCDLLANRCLLSLDQAISLFLQEFLRNMASSARLTLIEMNNWADQLSSTPLHVLVQTTYQTEACIDQNFGHPITTLRKYFASHTGFPNCPRCDVYYSIDNSKTPPPWCSERNWVGGSCGYQVDLIDLKAGPLDCANELVWCNADPFLPDLSTCENGQSFCGVCESPAYCHAIASITDPVACNQTEICILADGTVVEGISAAACATTYRCTKPCSGGVPCAAQNECLQQGSCDDVEGAFYLISATSWATNHSGLGFCAFPISPHNDPDCTRLYPGSYPSSYGCIRLGSCVAGAAFSLKCAVDFDTRASCTAGGGVWYPRPSNQAECEAPVLCAAPEITGRKINTLQNNLLFMVNQSVSDCDECAGIRRSINKWTPAAWLGGTSRRAAWTPRTLVSSYTWETTFDFAAFVEDFTHAAEESISFQLLNNLQCSRQYQIRQTSQVSCACAANTSDPSACFDSQAAYNIGIGRFCPFQPNEIVAPPFRIATYDDTISSQLLYDCLNFNISEVPVRVFDPVPVVTVTDAFKRKQPQQPRNSFATVRNTHDAVVGQVLGSAIVIEFDPASDLSMLSGPLLLCFVLSQEVIPDLGLYPVWDFGYPLSIERPNVQVLPTDIAVVYYPDINTLCGNVSIHSPSVIVAPIIRTPQYRDIAGYTLTPGQTACLYVVAALFSIGLALLLIFWAPLIYRWTFNSMNVHTLNFLYLILFTQRAIYLYLVPSGVLNQPYADQLADYFMMDFPICLYLIANLQIGLSFIFLHLKTRHFAVADEPRNFWICFGLGSFLILMLFISILLALRYEVLDQPPVAGSLLCPVYYDPLNTARTIRLIYQCLILAIALGIGVIELLLSCSLSEKMSELDSSNRILFYGIVSCIGIISDSTAFLIYYIVSDPHPYFSIVLIFTEIIPILMITLPINYRTSQTPVSHASRGTRGSKTSKGSI